MGQVALVISSTLLDSSPFHATMMPRIAMNLVRGTVDTDHAVGSEPIACPALPLDLSR